MNILKCALFIVLALTLTACKSDGTILDPGGFDRATEVQAMLSRHNATRNGAGAGQLAPNVLLNQIAQDQAEYMENTGNLSHEDNTGHHVDFRATAIGYGWTAIGENIGFDTDPAELYAGWLGSQGHHDNIVDTDFNEIGIGVAVSGIYQYWCIVFGRR